MGEGEGNAALSAVQGAWVEAGILGSLRILEASRVATGPEGPARPARLPLSGT